MYILSLLYKQFIVYCEYNLVNYTQTSEDTDYMCKRTSGTYIPVSYTHLDVYKRQDHR